MHPFLTHYQKNVVPVLTSNKKYDSVYNIPKVQKIIVNVGIGDVMANGKAVDEVKSLLVAITGQAPIETKARIAIAGFKIRQNNTVGLKVTLRGERMQDFLFKLMQISLPRTRDFRGIKPTAVTADGNLNIGIKDSMIFPEAPQDMVAHGIQVTIVSNATTTEETRLLFESLGFVFNLEVVEKKAKGGKRNYNSRKKK